MTTNPPHALDPVRADAFIARFLSDLGTAVHLPTVVVGDRLGLYLAMADGSPVTAAELAERTGTDRRYVAEWLAGQRAACYVDYDPDRDCYRLPPEHAAALVEGQGPIFIPAGFQMAASMAKDEPLVTEAFRTGRAVRWRDRDPDLLAGADRFSRAAYAADLTTEWIPALDGVAEVLAAGIDVADIGCGPGGAVILMAQAYPASRFVGFDDNPAAIDAARRSAAIAGVSRRVRFEVADAAAVTGGCWGLVTSFDVLHEVADPADLVTKVRSSLDAEGTWMIVEPESADSAAKIWSNTSTMLCTPAGRGHSDGAALGARWAGAGLRGLVAAGGFSRFRSVAATALRVVYEVRP
jgi:2-polyprenyl-3-methyl-5-hydroxy-6-metoxy-1,4-benzoquinol methylase